MLVSKWQMDTVGDWLMNTVEHLAVKDQMFLLEVGGDQNRAKMREMTEFTLHCFAVDMTSNERLCFFVSAIV